MSTSTPMISVRNMYCHKSWTSDNIWHHNLRVCRSKQLSHEIEKRNDALSQCWANYLISRPAKDFKFLLMKNTQAVAYLGYGRHGTWHGRHFDRGAKIVWKKIKAFFTVSWTSILRPIHSQTAKLHQHSPLPNRLICNKSGVLRQHHQALWQSCGIVT